jgi:hypothetical protein
MHKLAVLCITFEVGRQYVPQDLDRHALGEDLDWARTWYEVALKHGSDGRRKEAEHPAQPAWAEEMAASISKELYLDEQSALAFLVGDCLPKIFEKHFQRNAGLGLNPGTRKKTSPYLRFAVAVLRELNIKTCDGQPHRVGTISRAVNDVRSGRPRKQHIR